MRTIAIAGNDFSLLSHSIPWGSLGISRPQTFGGDPTDIILCGEKELPSVLPTLSSEDDGPRLILYSKGTADSRAAAVIQSLNPEQLISALRNVLISLNIRDANRRYFIEPEEVFRQELTNMTTEEFWSNVLVDCSCLRSAEEYEVAAGRCGIKLESDCRYILSMFMIYSHKAKFESWKPNTLEAVSKSLLTGLMEVSCIPVLETNRTQYFAIHPLDGQSSPAVFAARCERVTSAFLDQWGMNVFAVSSVPATVDGLWRQRIRLMLEFDDFYSNIGRSAATTVVESVRFLVEREEDEVPTRGKLAALLGFNPDYLSRIFHQQSGKTLADYLDEVRLRRAKKLLCEKSLTISEIASLLGYRNFSSFAQMFRRNTGQTPSEYRKKLK